jgi:hypothetical protein
MYRYLTGAWLGLTLLASVCPFLAMAAATSIPPPIIETWTLPSGQWVITPPSDYSYCIASFFDDAKQRRGIELAEYDKGVELVIIDPKIRMTANIAYGTFQLNISTSREEWNGKAYYSAHYHRGEISSSQYFSTRVDLSQLRALAIASKLTFMSGGRKIAERDVAGINDAVTALLKCRRSMIDRIASIRIQYAELNADMGQSAPVLQIYRPYPIKRQLPPELIRRGYADIRLTLNEQGFPTGCSIEPGQGADDFYQDICGSATRLIRFRAAQSGVGKIATGTVVRHRVHWNSAVRPLNRDMPARDNFLRIPDL